MRRRTWAQTLAARSPERWRPAVERYLGPATSLLAHFLAQRGTSRAASLSFSTVLSMVPMAAFMLGILAWTTDIETVTEWLHDNVILLIVPDIELMPRSAVTLGETGPVDNAQQATALRVRALLGEQLVQLQETSGRVGTLSALAMLAVAALLFHTIETAVNDVWHLRRRRHLMWKLILFTSMLVYAPLLLGLSVWLQGRLRLSASALPLGATILPPLLSIAFFTLFNWLVPYAPVRWRSALAGGLFSGVLFEIAKWGFAEYVGQGQRFSSLYGGLAVLPVLLLWVYYTWVVVLLGTHLSYGTQVGLKHLDPGERARVPARVVAWRLYADIGRRFERGERTGGTLELAERVDLPPPVIEPVLDALVDAGLLAHVDGREETYLPTRALERLSARDVLEAVEAVPAGADDPLAECERRVREAVPEITVHELASARPRLTGPR